MVIIEHMTKEQMPDSIREFKKVKSKKFGKSSLSYLRYHNEPSYSSWILVDFRCNFEIYGIGYINRVFSNPIPLGTLGVNILGSFLIGFLFLYFQHINISTTLKSLIITGLLGALTTFSTFSWETLLLIERGH